MSTTRFVSSMSAPSWHSFNRKLPEQARYQIVLNAKDPIVFWVVHVSRLGPFWTGDWNTFSIEGDRVVSAMAVEPDDPKWRMVTSRVRDVLKRLGLNELTASEVKCPASGLQSSRGAPGPTLFEALFVD